MAVEELQAVARDLANEEADDEQLRCAAQGRVEGGARCGPHASGARRAAHCSGAGTPADRMAGAVAQAHLPHTPKPILLPGLTTARAGTVHPAPSSRGACATGWRGTSPTWRWLGRATPGAGGPRDAAAQGSPRVGGDACVAGPCTWLQPGRASPRCLHHPGPPAGAHLDSSPLVAPVTRLERRLAGESAAFAALGIEAAAAEMPRLQVGRVHSEGHSGWYRPPAVLNHLAVGTCVHLVAP